MFRWCADCVIMHYLSGQQYFATLFLFASSLWQCCLFFLILSFTSLYASVRISASERKKQAALLPAVNQWIRDRWQGLFEGAVSVHFSRIGFSWFDESVSAPDLFFMQPIKPGRSCFGFIELSSVTYLGYLDPSFVQWVPVLCDQQQKGYQQRYFSNLGSRADFNAPEYKTIIERVCICSGWTCTVKEKASFMSRNFI